MKKFIVLFILFFNIVLNLFGQNNEKIAAFISQDNMVIPIQEATVENLASNGETEQIVVDKAYQNLFNKYHTYGKCFYPDIDYINVGILNNNSFPQLSKAIDSVCINVWNVSDKNYTSYNISYNNTGTIIIRNDYGKTIYTHYIDSIEWVYSFVDAINDFYINKTELIVTSKQNTGYIISTDYPTITIEGFQKIKKIFSKSTQWGNEEYQLVYNPKFVEFWMLLEKLITCFDNHFDTE